MVSRLHDGEADGVRLGGSANAMVILARATAGVPLATLPLVGPPDAPPHEGDASVGRLRRAIIAYAETVVMCGAPPPRPVPLRGTAP